MTTYTEYKKILSELEEYMNLAYYSEFMGIYSAEDSRGASIRLAEITESGKRIRFGSFIVASSVIAPEMMRIIDAAEEALNYALSQMQPFCSDAPVKEALAEIKKLKGK